MYFAESGDMQWCGICTLMHAPFSQARKSPFELLSLVIGENRQVIVDIERGLHPNPDLPDSLCSKEMVLRA